MIQTTVGIMIVLGGAGLDWNLEFGFNCLPMYLGYYCTTAYSPYLPLRYLLGMYANRMESRGIQLLACSSRMCVYRGCRRHPVTGGNWHWLRLSLWSIPMSAATRRSNNFDAKAHPARFPYSLDETLALHPSLPYHTYYSAYCAQIDKGRGACNGPSSSRIGRRLYSLVSV